MTLTVPSHFSLTRLLQENPRLARHYLCSANGMLEESPLWLHLGCGVRLLDGFVNLDVIQYAAGVVRWDLLDQWPDELIHKVEGVFSEDCFEHFFLGEQTYILCNINLALRSNGVARILMPNLHQMMIDYSDFYRVNPQDFLHNWYGVRTGGDMLNCGMRITGHRWLHDQQSIGQMSAVCGFQATTTECDVSTVAKFNNINSRNASLATDLRKVHSVSRVAFSAISITGAEKVEDLGVNGALFVSTSDHPVIEYQLPKSVPSHSVACINFQSSNLSSFDFGAKTLIIDDVNRAKPWHFDETMKSRPYMNVIVNSQLELALGGKRDILRLNFSPAGIRNEYFTLGRAEAYMLGID